MTFVFNDPATTEIYTLSLHDALPISAGQCCGPADQGRYGIAPPRRHGDRSGCRSEAYWPRYRAAALHRESRSEEHTSELQSQSNLVCRLLLEKKKTKITIAYHSAHLS